MSSDCWQCQGNKTNVRQEVQQGGAGEKFLPPVCSVFLVTRDNRVARQTFFLCTQAARRIEQAGGKLKTVSSVLSSKSCVKPKGRCPVWGCTYGGMRDTKKEGCGPIVPCCQRPTKTWS